MLNHVAIHCSSEENADKFYQELLGYKRLRDFNISPDLTGKIFGINRECKVIVYGAGDFNLEVYIVSAREIPNPGYGHICLQLADRETLVGKCRQFGIKVTRVEKGDRTLMFFRDYDNNLFEIK